MSEISPLIAESVAVAKGLRDIQELHDTHLRYAFSQCAADRETIRLGRKTIAESRDLLIKLEQDGF